MTHDEPDPDDALLDRLLAEELGGERAADRTARILAADSEARARAAAAVDAAARHDEPAPPRAAHRWRVLPLAAAVACAVLGLLALATWSLRSEALTPAQRAAALLDEFHRVMPSEPPALRDASRRERIAPAALPVLRELGALLATSPAPVTWADRAAEFSIYAVVLGDVETRMRLERERAAGRADAELQLASAAAITAGDDEQRRESLQRIAANLNEATDVALCAVRCLLIAGDLAADEATRLAEAARDEVLARRLRIGAELAASGPRRLLGQPFELAGRLLDGEEFSTTALRGKVVLVFFWASWCSPCATALPEIAAVAQRHARDGLAVVGVSCDHDRASLAAFLAKHPEITWPQFFEAGQRGWHPLAFWSGVDAVPRTFLVDRRGVLREIHTRGDLELLVQKLLAE